jgi:hypothetical protein
MTNHWHRGADHGSDWRTFNRVQRAILQSVFTAAETFNGSESCATKP